MNGGRIEGRAVCRHENVVSSRSRSWWKGDPQLGTKDSHVNLFSFVCVKL